MEARGKARTAGGDRKSKAQIGPLKSYVDDTAEKTKTSPSAVIMDCDEIDRELWHIDENLCRAELTEQERGEHLKRRQELFEARQVAEIQVDKIEPL